MEELNEKDLSWCEDNLKKGNPESKEQQKKRKRSVGKARVKVQTRFERHASLLSFFISFICLLTFDETRFYLTSVVNSFSKTCDVSIGISYTRVLYLSSIVYSLSKQRVFV